MIELKRSNETNLKIFSEIKDLSNKEKHYTALLLEKLMLVERDKLYCDLKYSSLHKYITRELKYSEAEATIRVNAVRLMLKSQSAYTKIINGSLTLTNAAEANKIINSAKIKNNKSSNNQKDKNLIEKIVKDAASLSTRKFKESTQLLTQNNRREVLILTDLTLKKFDQLRKKYGDHSTYELLQILLERELKAPCEVQRVRPFKAKVSRFIPKQVKIKVYTGKCGNCGIRHSLEYDHKLKYSHGGTNDAKNIQILCRNCNQNKEIKAKQTNFFA